MAHLSTDHGLTDLYTVVRMHIHNLFPNIPSPLIHNRFPHRDTTTHVPPSRSIRTSRTQGHHDIDSNVLRCVRNPHRTSHKRHHNAVSLMAFRVLLLLRASGNHVHAPIPLLERLPRCTTRNILSNHSATHYHATIAETKTHPCFFDCVSGNGHVHELLDDIYVSTS